MNNETILRSCEENWLDPDYEYPNEVSRKRDIKEFVRCDFCHEVWDKDECITLYGRNVCLNCAEEISEILEDMRGRL